MPRITFVNEHRVVEVETGRLISDVARDLGIAFCRESFAGTGIGDTTVWIKGASDCVSPPGFMERWKGARGARRFADRTRVLGDCEVTTQGGLADRLGGKRDLAAPPSPMADHSLLREPDAAATAAFPYGHPSAVGKGARAAIPRGGTEASKPKAPAAAKPAAEKPAAAPVAAAPTPKAEAAAPAPVDKGAETAAEKAARIAEKKARQAALKARLAGGAEGAAPAPPEAKADEKPAEAAPAAGKAIDPEKAARIAEKKARQAALKARLAAGDGADKPAAEAVPEPPAPEPAAEAKPPMDPEKAARIAEKKKRQAELKARLAAGDGDKPAAEIKAAPEPPAPEPVVEAKPPMDPEKAARIAEKKKRQAELKARLAAADPKPEGG